MAQLVTDPQGAIYAHQHPPRIWDFMQEFTTAQTNATIKVAVPGQRLFVTDIFIQVNGAVNVSLFKGSAATSPLLIKFIGSAASDGVARTYKVPKTVPAGVPITLTTSGAVTVEIEVHGYTAP